MEITILEAFRLRVEKALLSLSLDLPEGFLVQVSQSADLRFGDYQSNSAMVLAKRLKQNPRALAEKLVEQIEISDLGELSIAGPGFLNLKISSSFWASRMQWLLTDPKLGVMAPKSPEMIVLDFSAPNVAKPMHVGHIRSTIIGDCLGRVARFLGHEVKTDNHIGDWGTQFGMVIWGWKNLLDQEALAEEPLSELLRIYRSVNAKCKDDEEIKNACREELVKLQGGDSENTAIWDQCVEVSKVGLQKIYTWLEVDFDHWHGESYYNDRLPAVVKSLEDTGQARESDGAICVFTSGELAPEKDPFQINRDGEWRDNPMIVRKQDGAFNYATTDIATVDYRVEEWKAEKILYVVDARQSLHFQQLFDVARRRGISATLEHVSFGTILGENRKPLKTRDGDLPQLEDVLRDAVAAARQVLEQKSGHLPEQEKEELAETIGLGSVKFTELSHHRTSDYIFDLEKMVALEGDTAPYLQYSYVRVRSIFRKLEQLPSFDQISLSLREDEEIHLSRILARFAEDLPVVLDDYRPNLLATYLLDLAKAFHSFFEACPVLKSEGEVRDSRVALCELTARVLKQGLSLLGIKVPERM